MVDEGLGLYWDNGKENGSYYNGLYRGYIGIMEKKMESDILHHLRPPNLL